MVSAEAFENTDTVHAVAPGEWDELVRRLGGDGSYHSLGYHRASAHLEPAGTRPVLLHHRGRGAESALPLLLRPLPQAPGWDATTVYGYGGPLSTGAVEDPEFGGAVDEWARRNHVVTTFLRYHPLLGNHRLGPRRAAPEQVGQTVVWRTGGSEDLLAGMHTHHRRAVRKAERAGLEVRMTTAPADLAGFREIYELTMRRQAAADFYFFPEEYWTTLAAGGDTLLVEGLLGGETVAALLCLVSPPYLHYHLGASTDPGRSIGASNRLFLAAAEWARERAIHQFHLGGGVGGSESSLFVFKHRFDPAGEPQPFHVGRWVHDSARYAELADGLPATGYFPPWRQ